MILFRTIKLIPNSRSRLNIASTAATEIVLVILSAFTGILLARLLGPAARGEFAIVILWPSVIAGLGNLGIREALVYYQANGEHSSSELAGAGFLIALLQAPVLMVVGWLIVPILTLGKGDAVTRQSLYFLWFIPSNLFSLYALGLLRGQMRFHRFNLLRGSTSLLYLICIAALWMTKILGVQTLAISLLFSNAVVGVLAWASLLQRCDFRFPRGISLYRELFSYGIRNHFGTVSLMLNARLDQMLMAIFLTPIELGWYVVAVSVSGLTGMISATLEKLAFPRVAGADNKEQQKHIISTYSRYNLSATLLGAVAIMVLIPVLIPLFYSSSYQASVLPAEVLVFAGIFLSVNKNWEAGLRGLNQPAVTSKAEFISLLITGASLYFLLPGLRIFGAAIASLIAYFSTSIYLYLHFSRHWHFSFSDLLLPVSLSNSLKKLLHNP